MIKIFLMLLVAGLVVGMALLLAKLKKLEQSAGKPDENTNPNDDAPNKNAVDFSGYVRVKSLLTAAEYSFFQVLQLAIANKYTVMAKVRIADVIEIEKGAKAWNAKFSKINAKHIDFLLCDPRNLEPIAAIELDDASHNTAKRQDRDRFLNDLFAAVKLPCLRVTAAQGYNPNTISESISRILDTSK